MANETMNTENKNTAATKENKIFIPRYKLLDEENKKELDSKMDAPAKLVKRKTKSGQEIYSLKVAIYPKDVTRPTKSDPTVILEKRIDKIKYDLYSAILDKKAVSNGGSDIEEIQFKGKLRLSVGLNKKGEDCYIYDFFIIGQKNKKCISDYVNSDEIEYMQMKNFLPDVEQRIYSEDEEVDNFNFDF
ncbi:MAG: hypothetical protein E7184_00090 [Erysipelotrichaceae bacterium]|nr:hypothetical protein [Erysipelotrichaceae bacterium]